MFGVVVDLARFAARRLSHARQRDRDGAVREVKG
jgi:hypothetical protein